MESLTYQTWCCVGVAAAAAAAFLRWWTRPPAAYDHSEVLLDAERMLHTFDICTLSILRPRSTTTDADADAAGKQLAGFFKGRVHDITAANPWLTGRLQKVSGKASLTWENHTPEIAAAHFMHLRDAQDLGAIFVGYEAAFASGTMSSDAFLAARKLFEAKYMHKTALYMVYLVDLPLVEGEAPAFALITSMNHAIGDGYTYYALQGQLSHEGVPTALSPVRNTLVNDTAKIAKWMPGGETGGAFVTIAGVIWRAIFDIITGLTLRSKGGVYKVDSKWVEQAKEESKAKGRWVSTNDVMTMWFFNLFPKALHQKLMAVNLRGKLPGHTYDMAGNYVTTLTMSPNNGTQPGDLRDILEAGKNPAPFIRYPLWTRVSDPFTLITNWCTFYKRISTPTYEESFHMPLVRWGCGQLCVLFHCQPGVTGLLMATDTFTPAKPIEITEALAHKVAPLHAGKYFAGVKV